MAREMRFSGFRQRVTFNPAQLLAVDGLKRSGQQYQVAYNLKGVTRKGEKEWVLRNAALYHRFDISTGRALWIVTKGRMDVYESYKELTGEDGRPEDRAFGSIVECFASSLSPHLLFARWSNSDWREYVWSLEDQLFRQGESTRLTPRKEGHVSEYYLSNGTRDMRFLQIFEEQTSEGIEILQGNVEVLSSLRRFYQSLVADTRFTFDRQPCEGAVNDFASQVDVIMSDMRNHIARVSALNKMAADQKELVSLSIHQRQEKGSKMMLSSPSTDQAASRGRNSRTDVRRGSCGAYHHARHSCVSTSHVRVNILQHRYHQVPRRRHVPKRQILTGSHGALASGYNALDHLNTMCGVGREVDVFQVCWRLGRGMAVESRKECVSTAFEDGCEAAVSKFSLTSKWDTVKGQEERMSSWPKYIVMVHGIV